MTGNQPLSRRRLLTGVAAFGGVALLTPPPGAHAAPTAADTATKPFNVTPASVALRRLLPDHHRQVTLRALGAGGADRFMVTGRAGAITVEGTSPAVLLTGLNTYLARAAKADISWNGEQLNLPRLLPAPDGEIPGSANVPHRFALNDTNDGYTGPYRDWDAWERELDVLALHGINRVLVYTGGDAVYYDAFRQFGYSDAEMRAWIPAPAHQPWWLLQNMSGFGGPVSRRLIERRADLARKITDRVRELGMTPVLPGYFGTVPDDFVAKHGGDAAVVSQGSWGAFKRPDWLDPRTTAFDEVSAAFYRAQSERFGDSTMYKMDLLHEGGNPGDVPVDEAAAAVEGALQKAHPGAIWAILGWQSNPSKALLDGVDKSRMLIVDGLSDRYTTVTDRESDWGGTPYAFGSIWNFGGHTPMGANAPDWVEQYPKWRDKEGSALAGIAAMPEAADNNAPALALLTDLAWTPGTIDLDDWFAAYAVSRYGGEDPHAVAAWKTIRDTAYNMTRKDAWSEAPDGLFGARPSLGANKAAAWGPEADRYDTTVFDAALTELLQVAPRLRDSSAYAYDLADVTRQVLSNRSRVLLPRIKAAYEAGDRAGFDRLTKTWLSWMKLMDKVLATSPQHLLGRWLADARSWGATRAEKDQLEYDARSIITTWGGRESSEEGLHDYANREWAGLVGGLYLTRWKTYFGELSAALAAAGSGRDRLVRAGGPLGAPARQLRGEDVGRHPQAGPEGARHPGGRSRPGGADRVRRPGRGGGGPPGDGDRVVHQPKRLRAGDGRDPVRRSAGGDDRRAGRSHHRGVGRPGRDLLGKFPGHPHQGCRRAGLPGAGGRVLPDRRRARLGLGGGPADGRHRGGRPLPERLLQRRGLRPDRRRDRHRGRGRRPVGRHQRVRHGLPPRRLRVLLDRHRPGHLAGHHRRLGPRRADRPQRRRRERQRLGRLRQSRGDSVQRLRPVLGLRRQRPVRLHRVGRFPGRPSAPATDPLRRRVHR